MKRIISLLMKSFEYFLLKEYYTTTKWSALRAMRYLLIYLGIVAVAEVTSAFFVGMLLPALILFAVYSAVLIGISAMLFIVADKDREESELKIREYAVLAEELMNNLNSRLSVLLFLAFLAAFSITWLPLLTALAGHGPRVIVLIVVSSLFAVLFLGISALLYGTIYKKKPVYELLSIDPYMADTTPRASLLLIPFFASLVLVGIVSYLIAHTISISLLLALAVSTLFTALLHIFMKTNRLYNTAARTIFIKKTEHLLLKKISFIIKNRAVFAFYRKYYSLINSFVLSLIILLVANIWLKQPFTLLLIYAQFVMLLFSYRVFRSFNSYGKDANRPFIFMRFVIILAGALIALSFVNLTVEIKEGTLLFAVKDLVIPVTAAFGAFFARIHQMAAHNSFFHIILPVPLCSALYFIALGIQRAAHMVEKYADKRLKQELSGSGQAMIFGDNLSLYPFVLRSILTALVLFIIYIELPFLSGIIIELLTTLQVAEIFKVTFLTPDIIHGFFKIVFYLAAAYFVITLVGALVTALLSHVILMSDEMIIVENSLIKRQITRIPLLKINHLLVQQTCIERFLDIGTLMIETAERGRVLSVSGVTSISDKNKKIMEKVKIGLQKVK